MNCFQLDRWLSNHWKLFPQTPYFSYLKVKLLWPKVSNVLGNSIKTPNIKRFISKLLLIWSTRWKKPLKKNCFLKRRLFSFNVCKYKCLFSVVLLKSTVKQISTSKYLCPIHHLLWKEAVTDAFLILPKKV